MSSFRRIQASRANGRLALGPISPEGKHISSQNALRHGLLAQCIVMESESAENFDALLHQLIDRLQPADGVEFGMIEEMAAAYWRMRRAWAIETRMLENKTAAQPEGDTLDRMAAAIADPAAAPTLALVHRYEARLHLMYQRALHNLFLLRAAVPNEPSPISEHSARPAHALPAAAEPAAAPALLSPTESC
jgi:hypothetical protein